MDVLEFIGHYSLYSSVVDLTGYNATAPITHFGFTFNKILGMSLFSYNTSKHRAIVRIEDLRREFLQ